jgi:hypothetical protein
MTYSPAQAGIMTGTDYFRSVGVLQDGMAPIISSNKTMPTPDARANALTQTVTGTVLKSVQDSTNLAGRHYSFELGTTYDKVLGITYLHGKNFHALGFSENSYSGDQATQDYVQDMYFASFYQSGTETYTKEINLNKRDGTTYTALGTDTTIAQDLSNTYHQFCGVAIYLEDDVQKAFYKMGGQSQWVQMFSTTDGALTSGFQSVMIFTGQYSGNTERQIAPFMVWGA